MKTKDQAPNNSDGDSAGNVLAFNRIIHRWQVVPFNGVLERMFPHWEKLPDAPVKEEPAVVPPAEDHPLLAHAEGRDLTVADFAKDPATPAA